MHYYTCACAQAGFVLYIHLSACMSDTCMIIRSLFQNLSLPKESGILSSDNVLHVI